MPRLSFLVASIDFSSKINDSSSLIGILAAFKAIMAVLFHLGLAHLILPDIKAVKVMSHVLPEV
jgi:hypothetical protein